MNILIPIIIDIILAPIILYVLSGLYEKISDFSTDVYCVFLDIKDLIDSFKYNL